ncbi:trimethylamine monooxygenase-like [Phymastichus coffea]|uniref:trimethylamine monooxygenase-like n=1 Tax=Phymastichus coffea TaxID=108790 RepID=UPI00273BD58D|nr:trimethylamine monooxygenase-like [Phymastichus coffea]
MNTKWKTLWLLSYLILATYGGATAEKKRVCIIGTGVAGIAAVRQVSLHPEDFETVAFERRSDVGGLWIYKEDTGVDEYGIPIRSNVYRYLRLFSHQKATCKNVSSRIYITCADKAEKSTEEISRFLKLINVAEIRKPLIPVFDAKNLNEHKIVDIVARTNGPKDLMVFSDYVEFHGENRSYVTHMDMLRYIQNYTDRFNLRQYIQFNTIVEKVSAVNDVPDTQWNIRTQNLKTNEYSEIICDAVMVCNGHYSKYYVPDIPGMETFPGEIFHSIFYREPQQFTGKTVVIMGAGSSGTDIGLQVSWFAKKVYLSHRQTLGSELPPNMEEVPAVVSVNGNELTLSDDQVIIADAFVLCTGYEYDFPFLGDDSGIEVVEGKYVRPLYKHLISVEHPTMAFLGLQFPSIPYPVAYVQSQYFVSVLQGKTKLPSREEMLEDSVLPPGVELKKAHYMSLETIAYHDDLARLANLDILDDKHLSRVFRYWIEDKKNDIMYFKDKDVIVFEGGRVEMHRGYYPLYGLHQFEEDITIY